LVKKSADTAAARCVASLRGGQLKCGCAAAGVRPPPWVSWKRRAMGMRRPVPSPGSDLQDQGGLAAFELRFSHQVQHPAHGIQFSLQRRFSGRWRCQQALRMRSSSSYGGSVSWSVWSGFSSALGSGEHRLEDEPALAVQAAGQRVHLGLQ
jgi:hypothetical protein